MATTKRRATQYQYEPPVTPRQWAGDEERYAIRMSQILDDIYNKYGQMRTALNNKSDGGIAEEVDPTVPDWAKQPTKPTYTAKDVGAAPVGIATGEFRVANETELNSALSGFLNEMANNTVKFVTLSPSTTSLGFGSAVLCEIVKRTNEYASVRFTGYANNNPHVLYKTMWGGVWQPIAWENPPMEVGVEYRTLERRRGKAVYTKLIDFGNLPDSGHMRVDGVVTNGCSEIFFQSFRNIHDGAAVYTGCDGTTGWLDVYTSKNLSSWAYELLTLKYTKE